MIADLLYVSPTLINFVVPDVDPRFLLNTRIVIVKNGVRFDDRGEILGELVLAIKLGTPLQTLVDVIHPFPAFNRVLGASLQEIAAKAAQSVARV